MFLLILLIILACASGAYASISGNALYYFGVPLFAALTLLRLLWLLTVGRDSAPQSAAPAAKSTPQSARATQPELRPINHNALGTPPAPSGLKPINYDALGAPPVQAPSSKSPPANAPVPLAKTETTVLTIRFVAEHTATKERQQYLRMIDEWDPPVLRLRIWFGCCHSR